jgi:hypothetical protein
VALGEAAYQQALEYALERTQGTDYRGGRERVAIAQHPDVARMLLSIRSEVMGLRSLSYLIAAQIDKAEHTPDADERKRLQDRVALLTPVFKAYATERANLMAGTGIQIFGGMGFVEETGVAQLMRDARITTIYEGTTGIQARDLVFRKIQLNEGAALKALLDEIDADADRLEDLPQAADTLRQATGALRDQIAPMVSSGNLLRLNAGAVLLLEALGTLCCAWQLGNLAALALSRRDQDPVYYGNLIALAEYYFAHSLPGIQARLLSFEQAEAGIANYRFDD